LVFHDEHSHKLILADRGSHPHYTQAAVPPGGHGLACTPARDRGRKAAESGRSCSARVTPPPVNLLLEGISSATLWRPTMKRHRPSSGGTAVPRPPGRARTLGAVIGATVALFAAALLATACSSSSSTPQVASLGGHHRGAAVPSRLTNAQSDQAMLDY